MPMQVLDELSVIKLRTLANTQKLDFLALDFDALVKKHGLSLITIETSIDESISLEMPEGQAQDKNKDLENSILIHSALPSLTEIDATDERMWVTLSLREFKDYSLARWPYPKKKDKENQHRLNHWFAAGPRNRMRDNAISRLWWFYRIAWRVDSNKPEAVLGNLLKDSEYRSSILERPRTSGNRKLVTTILEIAADFEKRGISFNREKNRTFMKRLNLLGGRLVLAALDDKQLMAKLKPLYEEAYGL